MAEGGEVLGRAQAARPVRCSDRGERRIAAADGIEQDHRRVQRRELLDRLRRRLTDHQDETVGAAGRKPVEPAPVGCGGLFRRGEDDLAAGLARLGLGATQHLDHPRGVEARHDHVDQADRALRAGCAALVAAVDHDLLDPPARGLGDVGPAVEDLGDGRHRHAGGSGDLGDRHATGHQGPPTKTFCARTSSEPA
jgi:hypothetical protein